jgi:hypothetical protein
MVMSTWKGGWGDHARRKAASNQLGQMLPYGPISQGACLGKASIFEEISMIVWAWCLFCMYSTP